MGHDENAAARVRRLLAARTDVTEKRMVGGLSFLVDGKMCCGIAGDALMIRVGREGHARALAEAHVRPMKFGKRTLSGFICVEPEGFRTEAALRKWLERALDFVAQSPAETARARKPRSAPRR